MNKVMLRFAIIIVDSDDKSRISTKQWFDAKGFKTVFVACDGQDCLDQLSSLPTSIAVVFSKLDMEGMDGIELLRHVAKKKLASAFGIVNSEDPTILRTLEDLAHELDIYLPGTINLPVTEKDVTVFFDNYLSLLAEDKPSTLKTNVSKQEIFDAVKSNQFTTWYQPKVSIANGEWLGAEALSRWIHPEKGMIQPMEYIPVLEEMGVIDQLTWHQISVVAEDIKTWISQEKKIIISINISPSMLSDMYLPNRLCEITKGCGVSHDQIILEITESMMIENLSCSLETMARMRLRGFSLSMDDFGTGYANLQQLERMPCFELKMDKSLVTGATKKANLRIMLESNIVMAQKMDIKTVGEGVETQDDWFLLEEIGCDIGQGYMIGRPMPFNDLEEWYSDWNERYKIMKSAQ